MERCGATRTDLGKPTFKSTSEYLQDSYTSALTQLTIRRPLRNGEIYMKDAQCVEMNEKSIFRILFYKLWLIVFKFDQEFKNVVLKC